MAKKKRKYAELNALKGRIREKGTSYRKIADEMGMGANTLSDKINGFYPFYVSEMEALAILLDIAPKDVVHFFMPAYCKTQRESA